MFHGEMLEPKHKNLQVPAVNAAVWNPKRMLGSVSLWFGGEVVGLKTGCDEFPAEIRRFVALCSVFSADFSVWG